MLFCIIVSLPIYIVHVGVYFNRYLLPYSIDYFSERDKNVTYFFIEWNTNTSCRLILNVFTLF